MPTICKQRCDTTYSPRYLFSADLAHTGVVSQTRGENRGLDQQKRGTDEAQYGQRGKIHSSGKSRSRISICNRNLHVMSNVGSVKPSLANCSGLHPRLSTKCTQDLKATHRFRGKYDACLRRFAITDKPSIGFSRQNEECMLRLVSRCYRRSFRLRSILCWKRCQGPCLPLHLIQFSVSTTE